MGLVLGCGSTRSSVGPGEPAPAPSWRDALDELSLARPRTGAFSLSYFGQTTEDELSVGRWLQAIEWPGVQSSACGDFSTQLVDGNDAAGERWFLQIETSQTVPGTYPIVPSIDVFSETPNANVLLKLAAGNTETKRHRHTAIAGTVTVESAPQSEEEWAAGATLTGSVRAEFPLSSAYEVSCEVGGSTSGVLDPIDCTCERDTGEQFSCTRSSSSEPSCCHDLSGARVSVELEFVSEQCAVMCSATSTLILSWCEKLRDASPDP